MAPDIESWFQKDQFAGQAGHCGPVGRAHPAVAQNWVKADKLNAEYVADWQKTHPAEVAQWIKDNPDKPRAQARGSWPCRSSPSYSKTHPGTFPSAVEHKTADGKTEKKIEPVKEGTDIQSIFFDMWRQEHADADLERRAGRHGHGLRFGTGSRTSRLKTPSISSTGWPAPGPRRRIGMKVRFVRKSRAC